MMMNKLLWLLTSFIIASKADAVELSDCFNEKFTQVSSYAELPEQVQMILQIHPVDFTSNKEEYNSSCSDIPNTKRNLFNMAAISQSCLYLHFYASNTIMFIPFIYKDNHWERGDQFSNPSVTPYYGFTHPTSLNEFVAKGHLAVSSLYKDGLGGIEKRESTWLKGEKIYSDYILNEADKPR